MYQLNYNPKPNREISTSVYVSNKNIRIISDIPSYSLSTTDN